MYVLIFLIYFVTIFQFVVSLFENINRTHHLGRYAALFVFWSNVIR